MGTSNGFGARLAAVLLLPILGSACATSAQLAESNRRMDQIGASLERLDQRASGLEQKATALEQRIGAAEQRAAGAESAARTAAQQAQTAAEQATQSTRKNEAIFNKSVRK
jgi:hypothetical protein